VPYTAFTLQTVRDQVLDCVEALASLHSALRIKRVHERMSLTPESRPLASLSQQKLLRAIAARVTRTWD
jgi:uncharacterized protein (UPF0210 family)